jgi:DNA-binding MarR family transcriptional regulator
MDDRRQIKALATLLDQTGRLIAVAGHERGLHPVQWSALRYFARVSGAAATVNGLAAFQGSTPGPASRTVQALVVKRLVRMTPDAEDRRRKVIVPTPDGRKALKSDPLERLVDLLADLPPYNRAALADTLEHLVVALQAQNDPDALRLSDTVESAA